MSSVLNQSFQGWECIIVDGASKDNTIEIMEEYCEKDARFRYVSEPDNGIYDAFNKGWRLAKGQWIQYLGSDDK
ncbi:MAG TPA: glycosyltransferase, partial [Lachnospiraceae bacterium]|nr:glycosyltransferase [Lachnospiraceae bacterium]